MKSISKESYFREQRRAEIASRYQTAPSNITLTPSGNAHFEKCLIYLLKSAAISQIYTTDQHITHLKALSERLQTQTSFEIISLSKISQNIEIKPIAEQLSSKKKSLLILPPTRPEDQKRIPIKKWRKLCSQKQILFLLDNRYENCVDLDRLPSNYRPDITLFTDKEFGVTLFEPTIYNSISGNRLFQDDAESTL